MGASAAAEPLEKAALSEGGEGRPADSTDAREEHFTSIHGIKPITNKHQEVKDQ